MIREFKFKTPVFFAILAAMVFTSCSKEEVNSKGPAEGMTPQQSIITDKEVKKEMDALVEKLPGFAVYNESRGQYIMFNPFDKDQSKDFSFSDPNPGWHFSSSSGTEFITTPGGQNYVVVYPSAFGSGGSSGGTVVAGNSVLNINYTFCFAASEEALGMDIIDVGADFDGISGVIGIAGDFEALASGEFDESADFTDYFQGFAYYVVYDNEASGSYDVLNFFQDLEEDEEFLEGNAFAWVLDFTDPFGIYFSADGTLNVSGGSITFNGTYFGITGGSIFEESGYEEMNYVEVDGYGTMGC